MKTKFIAIVAFLLCSWLAKAQSTPNTETNAGKQGNATTDSKRENNSLLNGKGVPYTKESKKERQAAAKRTKAPIPASRLDTTSDVNARASGQLAPGSHKAQRDSKAGRKSAPKSTESKNR
ncbi:hypothetical protein GCM10028807_10140 [Spirosoma daeguense]